jgi:hypothetical protein
MFSDQGGLDSSIVFFAEQQVRQTSWK